MTELRRSVAKVTERARRANNRARFLREVRQAEAEYSTGSSTEYEDIEALVRSLKS